jgi:hypothetical protein
MVDIVMHNPQRVGPLFEVLLKRILEMAASPNSAARAASVNALQRTAMALLERNRVEAVTAPDLAGVAGADESLECRVMRAIVDVFRQPHSAADVQFACLDMVHHIIQVRLCLCKEGFLACAALQFKEWSSMLHLMLVSRLCGLQHIVSDGTGSVVAAVCKQGLLVQS